MTEFLSRITTWTDPDTGRRYDTRWVSVVFDDQGRYGPHPDGDHLGENATDWSDEVIVGGGEPGMPFMLLEASGVAESVAFFFEDEAEAVNAYRNHLVAADWDIDLARELQPYIEKAADEFAAGAPSVTVNSEEPHVVVDADGTRWTGLESTNVVLSRRGA